jgi:membrane-bound lytic murein transglycosylase D
MWLWRALPLLLAFQVVWAEGEDVEISTDTPVTHDEIEGDRSLTSNRSWRAPDYSNQDAAIGWTETTFAVPKGLETNVQFWIDIYSKYTTDQGVLHDSEYIDLVYEVMDFTSISAQADLNPAQKERLKTRRVKEAKKRIIDLLGRLEKTTDPSSLNEDEKRIWDYFQKIEGKKKFRDAMSKSRLRFQLGQRDRIIQGIFFSGRYLEDFERIFRDAGLPIELTRLPFVESSFNVLARSKVGASGLWQIMRYTGRPFMMINNAIDKRNHPTEATKLAAKLLRNNFQMLQSWPLALTGYNHGPSGVLKLTKLYKSRELGDLVQSNGSRRRLGFASRNFYASFLAVLEVEKNAPKYFGPVQWSQPLEAKDLILSKPIKYEQLLKWFDGDDHRAQIYNPHITSMARKGKIALPKGAVISVPRQKESEVLSDLASNEIEKKNQKAPAGSKTR